MNFDGLEMGRGVRTPIGRPKAKVGNDIEVIQARYRGGELKWVYTNKGYGNKGIISIAT